MTGSDNISNKEQYKFIDIEGIIQQKSIYLRRIIPNSVLKFLKKILHEDELNKSINDNKEKYDLDFIDAILRDFGTSIKLINENNIPPSGRQIIVSNHPLGGLDGMALMQVIGKKRKNLKFLVNDVLLNIENLKGLFIPINKTGKPSKEAAKMIDETFKSENLVLNFPFGLVSRKRRGKIMDLDWKKSFVVKAKQYKRDIIPVHINGKNSNFFYTLSNLRKILGIKTNIEMFFLVDEMYKQNNKEIIITIGQQISYLDLDNRYSDSEWAEKLRQYSYKLANDTNATFNI